MKEHIKHHTMNIIIVHVQVKIWDKPYISVYNYCVLFLANWTGQLAQNLKQLSIHGHDQQWKVLNFAPVVQGCKNLQEVRLSVRYAALVP